LIPKSPIKVTQQEIRHAVKQLNGGKSADEYRLMAEHFKLARNEILQIPDTINAAILGDKSGVNPNCISD
jgi:hypothetical protein